MKRVYRAVSVVSVVLATLAVPAAAQTGTVAGTVRYSGAAPGPVTLRPAVDRGFCGDSIVVPGAEIAADAVAQAVVSIEGLSGDVEPRTLSITNGACLFSPGVAATTVGSRLVVLNEDALLHNTHVSLQMGRRGRTMGNWSLPRAGITIENNRALRYPGLLEVKCDVHEWMEAFIWVFDHPFFGVTGTDGSFEIAGVPPGEYTLTVWHPSLGSLTRTVEVGPAAALVLELDLMEALPGS